jgi:hypothetical protein
LAEKGEKTPPFEPIATWGGRTGPNHYWSWSPRWEAAAGHALAHLLVASQGQPVQVPRGLTADVFQRALDALLPTGAPKRRAVLAGPGQPSPDAGLFRVVREILQDTLARLPAAREPWLRTILGSLTRGPSADLF